jgi:hypothetical protein
MDLRCGFLNDMDEDNSPNPFAPQSEESVEVTL